MVEALFAITARASAPEFPSDSRDEMREMLEHQLDEADSAEMKGYLAWLGGLLTTDD